VALPEKKVFAQIKADNAKLQMVRRGSMAVDPGFSSSRKGRRDSCKPRRGPTVCIPGISYKLIVLLIRYLPKWIERTIRTPLMKSRV
jgi:hypothetical protein